MTPITDKETALNEVKRTGFSSMIFNNFRDDKEVVKAALKITTSDIQYASERLKSDVDLAKFVVKRKGYNISLFSDSIKDNREIAMLAVKNNGTALESLSERLRDDTELALIAIQRNDSLIPSLRNASDRLKSDKEFALIAVKSFFLYLDDLDKKFKDDLDVIYEVIKQKNLNKKIIIEYSSPRIQKICEGKDPILAIETEIKRIEAERLNRELTLNLDNQKRKIKL